MQVISRPPTVVGSPAPPRTLLGRWTAFVLRHRRIVVVFWLVAFLCGGFAASRVSSRLTVDFSLPGQPGYETGLQILHTFGNGGETSPSILVVTVPPGQTVAAEQATIPRRSLPSRSGPGLTGRRLRLDEGQRRSSRTTAGAPSPTSSSRCRRASGRPRCVDASALAGPFDAAHQRRAHRPQPARLRRLLEGARACSSRR